MARRSRYQIDYPPPRWGNVDPDRMSVERKSTDCLNVVSKMSSLFPLPAFDLSQRDLVVRIVSFLSPKVSQILFSCAEIIISSALMYNESSAYLTRGK